jgi:hypothetical protein
MENTVDWKKMSFLRYTDGAWDRITEYTILSERYII